MISALTDGLRWVWHLPGVQLAVTIIVGCLLAEALWALRSQATREWWWRWLRVKCVVCGGARDRTVPHWRRPHRWACNHCNKRIMHGWNYGMSERFGPAARDWDREEGLR